MKRCNLSFAAIFFSLLSLAQEQLTLEQAIEIALKNNYSILIAKNEEEISMNEATKGNAGMLPLVNLNASQNFSNNSTKQEYSNGNTLDRSGVGSQYLAAGLVFSWTIFDGLKMFATYDKLKELQGMGELNAKIQIENNLMQIISVYYDIVKDVQLYIGSDSAMEMYSERLNISEQKWKIGAGSKSDFLQARVDKNEQLSIQLRLRNTIESKKIALNHLLGRKAETDFSVINEIVINPEIKLEEAANAALNKNSSIQFYNKRIALSEFALKEIRAQQFPSITLNSSYNFARTENQAGFFLLNQNLGFSYGVAASWKLFNGFNTRRQIRNSGISLLNEKLNFENVKSQVQTELMAAFKNYRFALEVLILEEENSHLATENSQIMLDRYRFGNATSLDIKTAQKSYYDALSRLILARYEAKLAETALLRLKGELVK